MTSGTTVAAHDCADRSPYRPEGALSSSGTQVPSRMRRLATSIIIGFVAIVVGFGLALVGTVSPAHAEGEGTISSLVNQARADNGQAGLLRNASMDQVALDWANQMASSGSLSHNPNFSSQIPSGWTGAAENVATGQSDAAAVHAAWMDSAGHRENILGDYTDIGIAFIRANGTTWGVEVFGNYADQAGPAPSDGAQNVSAPSQGTAPAGKDHETTPTTAEPKAHASTQPSSSAKSATATTAAKAKVDAVAKAKAKAEVEPANADMLAAAPSATPSPSATAKARLTAAAPDDSPEAHKKVTFTLLSSSSDIGQFSGGAAELAGLGFGGLLVGAASVVGVWPTARRWWLSGVLRRF